MLNSLTQKLCPFVSITALALCFGCGKKMAEKSDSQLRDVQGQLPSPVLILTLDDSSLSYRAPYYANFNIPYELKVNSGNTTGKTVSVTYDIESNGYYDYKCFYKGNAAGTNMVLKNCTNYSGTEAGTVDQLLDTTFRVHGGNSIKLETSNNGLVVEAIYQMTWIPDAQ